MKKCYIKVFECYISFYPIYRCAASPINIEHLSKENLWFQRQTPSKWQKIASKRENINK